jgi:hypothetical protein
MKRIVNSLLFAMLIAVLAVPETFAACTQGGQCNVGGCVGIQFLYNYDFSETCSPIVWNRNNVGAVTIVKSGGLEMCNGYFQSYARMNYNNGSRSKVWQTVTIPADEFFTHWTAAWNISITDPNHDSWNEVHLTFYDVTAGTTIGTSQYYYGDSVDPDCRRDILSLGTRNLAGHTIQVEINASVNYTNTHFYVTNVSLSAS